MQHQVLSSCAPPRRKRGAHGVTCGNSRAAAAAVAETKRSAPQEIVIPRGETGGASLVVDRVSLSAGDRYLMTDVDWRVMPGSRGAKTGGAGVHGVGW